MRTGELETQLGMDAALEAVEHDAWLKRARFVMAAFCAAGMEFDAEDVREQTLGDVPGSGNAVGALFKQCAREGWITPTGRYRKARRPEAHGRILPVWRSAS